jgi:hypothetical protein
VEVARTVVEVAVVPTVAAAATAAATTKFGQR